MIVSGVSEFMDSLEDLRFFRSVSVTALLLLRADN
jgi:hypothetical protein